MESSCFFEGGGACGTEGGGGGRSWGSRGCESERQRFFTWEKNVDEMNGREHAQGYLSKNIRSGLMRTRAAVMQEVKVQV